MNSDEKREFYKGLRKGLNNSEWNIFLKNHVHSMNQTRMKMHSIQLFIRHTMESSWGIGILSLMLVVVPIIGMDLVHKYGWEHWEPFAKHHK